MAQATRQPGSGYEGPDRRKSSELARTQFDAVVARSSFVTAFKKMTQGNETEASVAGILHQVGSTGTTQDYTTEIVGIRSVFRNFNTMKYNVHVAKFLECMAQEIPAMKNESLAEEVIFGLSKAARNPAYFEAVDAAVAKLLEKPESLSENKRRRLADVKVTLDLERADRHTTSQDGVPVVAADEVPTVPIASRGIVSHGIEGGAPDTALSFEDMEQEWKDRRRTGLALLGAIGIAAAVAVVGILTHKTKNEPSGSTEPASAVQTAKPKTQDPGQGTQDSRPTTRNPEPSVADVLPSGRVVYRDVKVHVGKGPAGDAKRKSMRLRAVRIAYEPKPVAVVLSAVPVDGGAGQSHGAVGAASAPAEEPGSVAARIVTSDSDESRSLFEQLGAFAGANPDAGTFSIQRDAGAGSQANTSYTVEFAIEVMKSVALGSDDAKADAAISKLAGAAKQGAWQKAARTALEDVFIAMPAEKDARRQAVRNALGAR